MSFRFKHEYEDFCAHRSLEQQAIRAIWVDGPDSEARRAARMPDSTHTPAVRRVVAWEASGKLSLDADAAYLKAANSRMVWVSGHPSAKRLRRRMESISDTWGLEEMWDYWNEVLDRLAAYLRHRDERAGYR